MGSTPGARQYRLDARLNFAKVRPLDAHGSCNTQNLRGSHEAAAVAVGALHRPSHLLHGRRGLAIADLRLQIIGKPAIEGDALRSEPPREKLEALRQSCIATTGTCC